MTFKLFWTTFERSDIKTIIDVYIREEVVFSYR